MISRISGRLLLLHTGDRVRHEQAELEEANDLDMLGHCGVHGRAGSTLESRVARALDHAFSALFSHFLPRLAHRLLLQTPRGHGHQQHAAQEPGGEQRNCGAHLRHAHIRPALSLHVRDTRRVHEHDDLGRAHVPHAHRLSEHVHELDERRHCAQGLRQVLVRRLLAAHHCAAQDPLHRHVRQPGRQALHVLVPLAAARHRLLSHCREEHDSTGADRHPLHVQVLCRGQHTISQNLMILFILIAAIQVYIYSYCFLFGLLYIMHLLLRV